MSIRLWRITVRFYKPASPNKKPGGAKPSGMRSMMLKEWIFVFPAADYFISDNFFDTQFTVSFKETVNSPLFDKRHVLICPRP
jgi:hypothetical protein